ncbi:MAG: type II toxin-antitoxin system antitoxin SocA domain-containing protein [Candidatus Sedimenticola sp. 20ELBAFRAG]
MSINNVCDYVITSVISSGETLSNLKLQKLLYYVQAWHLVFENDPLFDGKFEAWVHGPVSRSIYGRFASSKTLYSDIAIPDCQEGFSPAALSERERNHVDRVLSVYAKFSGPQLEDMTHREDPWVKARDGCEPWDLCDNEIDEALMRSYYAQRLS